MESKQSYHGIFHLLYTWVQGVSVVVVVIFKVLDLYKGAINILVILHVKFAEYVKLDLKWLFSWAQWLRKEDQVSS